MRTIVYLALAATLLGGGVSLAADADTAATDNTTAASVPAAKIGVVDMQTIAMDCDPAKAFKQEMEKKYDKERSALEKQGNALKKQAEALKNPKTSDDKKRAFMTAKQKLDQETRNFMRKIEQEELKFRQDIVSLVFSATYNVARAKGYNFVVDVTAGGVLYADKSMDLTKDVLAEVNKLYTAEKDKPKAETPAKAPAGQQAPAAR